MKVQYLLNFSQINAIHTMVGVSGIISIAPDNIKLVEYDISEEQKYMLDALLNQNGSVIKEHAPWPSEGDNYYYIDNDGEILHGVFVTTSRVDNRRHNIGNVFKTQEEAEFELERLKVLNQLKSLSDDDQKWDKENSHYYIAYDLSCEEFSIWSFSFTKLPYNIYFKSKVSAEAAIKTVGEDKLKKYVFNVKE